jgi:NAD(P)-dependent dehydrogenase (short-subunit alcohol dehydrogenase family)
MVSNYDKLFDMHGKVVLAAGGSGAIGSEMASVLAHYGARVAIAGISLEACEQTAAEIAASGADALAFELDVRDESSVRATVAEVEARLGPVDVLINAVGTHIEQPAQDVTMEAWDTILDINLRGAFLLSQAVANSEIGHGRGGSHIHVTSVRSGLGIRRGYAAYCASKGGLGILIKQLATEWAHHGIRVNGIAPTFTRTPLVQNYLNDPVFYQSLINRIPMGRVCETSDLAGIALFLASDAASFITGQNIYVDGGVTASQ